MNNTKGLKQAMQWRSTSERPACSNCRQSENRTPVGAPRYQPNTWYCTKGAFITSAMAICDHHEWKRK